MKSRGCLALFALPFAAVGAFMAWSVGNTLVSASQMEAWVPVEATLYVSEPSMTAGWQSNSWPQTAVSHGGAPTSR